MDPRKQVLTQLDETILSIANFTPGPDEWRDWVLYLLEGLDWQAKTAEAQQAYNSMLAGLHTEIQARLEQQNWWAASMQKE
jgi:hypothetical protein